MTRLASVFVLCLLAVAAAAAPDYSQDAEPWAPEEAQEEQQRGGEEAEQWQGDDYAAYQDEQEAYQLRGNAEQQQVQKTELVRDEDEGTLDSWREETLRDQQEQQQGQLQQNNQWGQQTGDLQQDIGHSKWTQQTGDVQQDNQWGQPQQNNQWGQQTGNMQDSGRGDKPQSFTTPKPAERDFGIVQQNPPPQNTPPQNTPPQNTPPQNTPEFSGGSFNFRPQPPIDYQSVQHFGSFKVYTTPLTWPEALVTCWNDGAQLAVPNSMAEAKAVGELYGRVKKQVKKSQDNDLFFIGASDLNKEGTFVTVWGKKFNAGQWHNWQAGEPNNHKKNEHCVLSNEKGYYWDGNCQAKYSFVCQHVDLCSTKHSSQYDNFRQSTGQSQQQGQTWN